MAIVFLSPHPNHRMLASLAATCRLNGTTGVAATIKLDPQFNKLTVSVPTLTSGTFKISRKSADGVGGTAISIKADLDGNSYPRTADTGADLRHFLTAFGDEVYITASVSGGMLRVQAWR